MSATSQACNRLIKEYVDEGGTLAQAVDAAIDRTSHDIVFFRGTNPGLRKLAENRLRWLHGYKARMTKE